MKGNILQVENMNYIRNQFGKELWVQVCGHREMHGADGLFWVGLIPNEGIEESLKKTDWDLSMGELFHQVLLDTERIITCMIDSQVLKKSHLS